MKRKQLIDEIEQLDKQLGLRLDKRYCVPAPPRGLK